MKNDLTSVLLSLLLLLFYFKERKSKQINQKYLFIIIPLVLTSYLYAQSITSRNIYPQTNVTTNEWRLAPGTEGIHIRDIEIYLSNPDTMYGSGLGFLLSTNGGENWTNIAPPGPPEIEIDPLDSKRIWGGHSALPFDGTAVILSTDGGLSWNGLFYGFCMCSPVVEFSPANYNDLYVGVGDDILWSLDRGQNWDSLSLSSLGLQTIAIAPSNENIIYATYSSTLFKSTDKGKSWTELSLGFSFYTGLSLVIDPQDPAIVYVGLYSMGLPPGGIYKTTNGGLTWEEKNNGLTSIDWDITYILVNPKKNNEIFLGTISDTNDNRILFKSTDGGDKWQLFNVGLPNSISVDCIVIDTIKNKMIIALYSSDSSGIYILDGLTNISTDLQELQNQNQLTGNYPNPFNSSTRIVYHLYESASVKLNVYDMLGKLLLSLVNEQQIPGEYNIFFEATEYPSGMYIISLQAGIKFFRQKIMHLK